MTNVSIYIKILITHIPQNKPITPNINVNIIALSYCSLHVIHRTLVAKVQMNITLIDFVAKVQIHINKKWNDQ